MAGSQIVALWADLRGTALPQPRLRRSRGKLAEAARSGQGRAGDMPGSVKREHQAERLQAIRLRYSINIHLEGQGISTPVAIGAATGLPADEAIRLLSRRQWREGDVEALKAVAGRLGLEVPLDGLGLTAEPTSEP